MFLFGPPLGRTEITKRELTEAALQLPASSSMQEVNTFSLHQARKIWSSPHHGQDALQKPLRPWPLRTAWRTCRTDLPIETRHSRITIVQGIGRTHPHGHEGHRARLLRVDFTRVPHMAPQRRTTRGRQGGGTVVDTEVPTGRSAATRRTTIRRAPSTLTKTHQRKPCNNLCLINTLEIMHPFFPRN